MYKTALILLLMALPLSLAAQNTFPWLESPRAIHDLADILPDNAERRLEEQVAGFDDFDASLRIVTLPSRAGHGEEALDRATFAKALQEAIARLQVAPEGDAKRGPILLLLIRDENALEILPGTGWDPPTVEAIERIAADMRARHIARTAYTDAILEGTDHLDNLLRHGVGGPQSSGSTTIAFALLGMLLAAAMGGFYWHWRRNAITETLTEAVAQQHGSLIMRRLKKGDNPNSFDAQGYSSAIYAASQGDVGVLKQLAEYGADLGLATGQGETPLYSAAQHGQLQSVLYLLRQRVPVDPETVHRETPLLIAAREGHLSIVRALLEAGANVNQQDNRGWSALMIAMRENQTELVNLLLGHNVDVNLCPKDGANAVMMAVKAEDEDLVRRLIDRGADVHHESRDGMCALRIAVLRGNQAIARRLLNAGADVSAPFANKETPVEVAEREGYKELAAYLRKREKRLAACMDILEVVARGDLARVREIVAQVPKSVNVHSASSRWTPLLIAVRAGQTDIAATLLEHGADVHARSKEGKSAIALAVDTGDLAMVKVLLEGGARTDQVDGEGTDLRTYAETQRQEPIVAFLDNFVKQQEVGFSLFQAVRDNDPPRALTLIRENPACVDSRTRNERWTPLMQAIRDENIPLARLLIEHGAQINLANSRGMTALMYAARGGNLELVRLLINQGADVRPRSREGNTACEFALDRGHARVVMLLQEVEAQLSDLSRMDLDPDAETKFDGPARESTEESGRAEDIFEALRENDIRLAKQVLHYWPDCVRLRRGPSELTPLHLAIHGGLRDMVRLIVEAGADINAKTREGKTPLYLAVARADADMATFLLQHGAQVWQLVQGQTALQVAQAAGYTDIVAELNKSTAADH